MANQLYKDHLLIWTAEYDDPAESWTALVNISWRENGLFQFHRLKGSAKLSQEEAMTEGLMLAKLWVDGRL